MVTVRFEPHWADWRDRARALLQRGIRPEEVDWVDVSQGDSLLQEGPSDGDAYRSGSCTAASLTVPG